MTRQLVESSLLVLLLALPGISDVVINEIGYNPPDVNYDAGSLREFVELYNPGPHTIDLTGYRFTKGISFTFPENTLIAPNAFLVLVRDLRQAAWRGNRFPVIGPFEGELANGGERLELVRPDGTIVDSLRYDDREPWSKAADGYGPTLEKIAWDLPSDGFHSWRASLFDNGTPGAVNSVIGIPPRPVITATEIIPPHPTSNDTVTVRFGFNAPTRIESATLQWELPAQGSLIDFTIPVTLFSRRDNFRYWKGQTAPSEGLGWTQSGFSDTSWPQGGGMFGYGMRRNINTQLNDMRGRYSTVYLRRRFTVKDAAKLKTASLSMYFSGGFICYLNGREVARANVTDPYTHASLATRTQNFENAVNYTITNSDGLFMEGSNTVAIVGFTYQLNGDSFGIGATLYEGERIQEIVKTTHPVRMSVVAESIGGVTFEAQIPPMPSQSLVRCNAQLSLVDPTILHLPCASELKPFVSYFVYDGEIQSLLPVLWPYYPSETQLPAMTRKIGGAVILPSSGASPLVFDGAFLSSSRNGQKLKFLKDEEFRNDRTLNILPERPSGGTTAGISTPHREDLGFWFFREFAIPSPRTDWFRLVINKQQTQQLLIQQVNEKFLEMNGLNPNADLFKRNYVSPYWEPHTNLENGTASIDALTRSIRLTDQNALHEALSSQLDMEEFLAYVVASVLTSNWDGFHNNHWMYLDPDTKKWQMIPWDLDKAWGYTDSKPMFVEMPIDFPLNGQAAHAARETGPVTGWLMKDSIFYQDYIQRLAYELNRSLSEERMFARIDEIEQFLLADITLLESATGTKLTNRRTQIAESYETIRTFIRLRREFLTPLLPTSVSNWSLY